MCQECELLPPNPVCGPDGRNHKTECAAVYCAGIPAIDLLEGPCQSNVSSLFMRLYLITNLSYIFPCRMCVKFTPVITIPSPVFLEGVWHVSALVAVNLTNSEYAVCTVLRTCTLISIPDY